jgi:hypothetical protein
MLLVPYRFNQKGLKVYPQSVHSTVRSYTKLDPVITQRVLKIYVSHLHIICDKYSSTKNIGITSDPIELVHSNVVFYDFFIMPHLEE